jgi:hypothetical protein
MMISQPLRGWEIGNDLAVKFLREGPVSAKKPFRYYRRQLRALCARRFYAMMLLANFHLQPLRNPVSRP